MPFKFLALGLSFFLLSCQPFHPTQTGTDSAAPVTTENFNFNSSFKIDPDCTKKSEYNACLFLKNPVHQNKQPFSQSVPEKTELQTLQTVALNLSVNPGSTHLRNGTIEVIAASGKRAQSTENNWKFPAGADNNDEFGQVMAYFWLTHSAVSTRRRLGVFHAFNKEIKISVNDDFTGWAAHNNTIHVSKPKNGNFLTHNAGLMIYFLGLANLHHATENGFADFAKDDSKHRSCGKTIVKPRHCCKSELGCAMAISSGVADYFVATMFPEAPTLGESLVNRLTGLQACGVSRDLNDNKDLSVTQAFGACADKDGKGYIYNLGTIYASIWWEVRKKSVALEIDQLYQHHLSKLTTQDDFKTAFDKVIATDQELFLGKYRTVFEDEFRRRGILP